MTILAIDPRTLGPSYQEAKEGIADALINMTVARCSGEGRFGEFVFGRLPQRAFVSGHLLPRYDQSGDVDETDDIHIAVIGLDFQVDAKMSGAASALPRFSVYLRVLPTWEEISDERLGLRPTFNIKPSLQKEIDKEIWSRLQEEFKKHGVGGENDRKTYSPDEWRAFKAKKRDLRVEVSKRVHAERGIIYEESAGAQNSVGSGRISDPAADTAAGPIVDERANNDEVNLKDEGEPEYKSIRGGRHVPSAMAQPVEIPLKWKRLVPELPAFRWDLGGTINDDALEAFALQMWQAITASVDGWLSSPEGQREAWRDVDVTPDDVLDGDKGKEAWDRFLVKVRATPPDRNALRPPLEKMHLTVQDMPNFADASVRSIRVALENNNRIPTRADARQHSACVFQCSIDVVLPADLHRPLRPDRIEPSYRFRHHMAYPAIGLNNGVMAQQSGKDLILRTTWAPRFVQPRVIPTELDVPLQFGELMLDTFEPAKLNQLVIEYRRWIDTQASILRKEVRADLPADMANIEIERLDTDLAAWKHEVDLIERGIRLLSESKRGSVAALTKTGGDREKHERIGIPWAAWKLMNRAFYERDKPNTKTGWRLFQLAFVLAHLPTLSSRIAEFADRRDPLFDDEEASLLYFATGGGKSEAFYGTLIFALFLDRLRGKNRGVTGLVRYPLRLLTLQQAQRFLRLLIQAELIRHSENIGTWPFEIGFWVGANNTPNRASAIKSVPDVDDDKHPDDQKLDPENLPSGISEKQIEAAQAYDDIRTSYCKIPECPACRGRTGLRMFPGSTAKTRMVGIVCFNSECGWNKAHSRALRSPLPFLLTDDTIYQRAPSVILGTIDKLAMIGQHPNTITAVMGMFGAARWIDGNGHLLSPRRQDEISGGPAKAACSPVFPAYKNGTKIFVDPFPSLIIQDETHLLEESLGTFSGLFETTFETMLRRIDRICGNELEVARGADGSPRLPKIIAATATVSNPQKQLAVLYQRRPLRFPHPGPDLYRSFYAEPAAVPPEDLDRVALAKELGVNSAPEKTAPWMRLFVSVMTNGSNHTTTTVAILSAFHLGITELWRGLLDPTKRDATSRRLLESVGAGRDGAWRSAALQKLVDESKFVEIMALLDLHRIALTYVTNKKGGDQVIDALEAQARRDHELAGLDLQEFRGDLITGGIDMGAIQDVMKRAEAGVPVGTPYPDVSETLRSIVATSAISHGVDVDRFNSMFFAGMPPDVAEYIQASSRVGRAHVGFVVLIPTPQSRRDRYVVETHDIFHRFLERMIAAPAAERWAENALKRVAASVIQAWCVLGEIEEFRNLTDEDKRRLRPRDVARVLREMISHNAIAFRDDLFDFMKEATGFHGRGNDALGKPHYSEHYATRMEKWIKAFSDAVPASSVELRQLWTDLSVLQPPMRSLRDVDDAAVIVASGQDPFTRRWNGLEAVETVMRTIRGQRSRVAESDIADDVDADAEEAK